MNRGVFRVLALLGLALVLGACVPATPGRSSDQGQTVAANESRTFRMVTRQEPVDLSGGGGASRHRIPLRVFAAGLSSLDSHEAPYPVLAESLPRLNTDTWKVFPDGRMEAIYRLRPGLQWHDGAPLTAPDFAFSFRATKAEATWGTPVLGVDDARTPAKWMDEIVALDSQTLVIRWPQAYPAAGNLAFPPLPRHLLEAWLDRNDSDAYHGLDYWTTAYVGAGPFRLASWERGAFIEGAAFEGYALGRPKIDRIVLTFSEKPTTTVARLLADDVDMAVAQAIGFQETSVLKQEWVPRTQGRLLFNPNAVRHVQIQARPAYADPAVMLDVRVRRALLHAIDRPALAEAMVDERGMTADAMLPQVVPFYADVDRAITKYPFDIRRTEQLMAETGFAKGADGFFVSSTGGRFSPQLMGVNEGQDAQDTTIVADSLKRAGIDVQLYLYPVVLRRASDSDEFKGSFPAMNTNSTSVTPPLLGLDEWDSPTIGTPQNNWKGHNRIGWSTPEYDHLLERFNATLDKKEGDGLLVRMLTILSNELPVLPLYSTFFVDAHVGSLHGPEVASPSSSLYYNIHQWEWQ